MLRRTPARSSKTTMKTTAHPISTAVQTVYNVFQHMGGDMLCSPKQSITQKEKVQGSCQNLA